MNQMPLSESIIIGISTFQISTQFLEIQKHFKLLENSKLGQQLYADLNLQIQKYYAIISKFANDILKVCATKSQFKDQQVKQFDIFLTTMMEIFTSLSTFKIQSLGKSRYINFNNLENNFYNFRSKLEKYTQVQIQLKQKKDEYSKINAKLQEIKKRISKQVKKIDFYFNQKLTKKEVQIIKESISQKEKCEQKMNELIELISDNSNQFEKDLASYKQSLIINKYQNLRNLRDLTKNSKKSLAQLMVYLSEIISQKFEKISNFKSYIQKKKMNSESHETQLSSFILEVTKEYNQKIDYECKIIEKLIDQMNNISSLVINNKKNREVLIKNISQYYEADELPLNQIISTFDFYDMFLLKFTKIADRIQFSLNNLLQIKRNVNNHTEIILSLVKCESKHKLKSNDQKIQNGKQIYQYKYINQLFDQMSDDYLQNIQLKIYHDFKDAIVQIQNQYIQKYQLSQIKKKKLNNSMSISVVQQQKYNYQKRPLKNQFWLWENWRVQINKSITEHQFFNKIISQFETMHKIYEDKVEEVEKIICNLKINSKIKGYLILMPNGLIFESIDGSVRLNIPFLKIENVDLDFNFVSSILKVETTVGIMIFSNQNLECKRICLLINKLMDSYNDRQTPNAIEENKIILNQAQIECIKKRQIQISSHFEKEQNYQLFGSLILNNTDIRDVYSLIFSDDPLNVKGKQFECYLDYMMPKYKNFNAKIGKYDKKGPAYFINQSSLSFSQCPIFSTRIIEYDHELPKIPFMPSSCHNHQEVKLYWKSHEAFDYIQVNHTSGVKFAQNLETRLFTSIKQIQKNVEIKFNAKVIALKQFPMMSMIINKSYDQIRSGVQINTQNIKYIINLYKRKPEKIRQVNENQKNQNLDKSCQDSRIQKYLKKIQLLQKQNKFLIYGLILVFLLNVAIKIFL